MAQYLSQPPVERFRICLSEIDHSILGAEIDRLVDHISGLNDQLNVLRREYQARMTPILEERAKKLPKYNFLVNFVSPIGQLPHQSLSEIFTQALFRGGSSTGSRPRPLIYFDIDLGVTRVMSEGVKAWISRSRALPVEVHLDPYPEDNDKTTYDWMVAKHI
ncbi:hypothetical protein C8J55DRAFT_557928 [Lentinula edodes]|uniref:Uncharacterized protein n=1 Tax=Lentinula lateritia TaxID=40482 RepID=A0A9W9ASV3_9AGAR|nr:hypothetical protein C8J55DRAFT_557928 [Lentinula edodes]